MDSLDNGRDKLASIRLTERIPRIALVLWEESVPLLQELVQIISHIIIGGGELVREAVASTDRVVNVDHVVSPGPGPLVVRGAIEVVVVIGAGDHWTMQLESSEHGGSARSTLQPDHHRSSLRVLSSGEEPEEHVAIVCWVHSQQARVALHRLIQSCRPQA